MAIIIEDRDISVSGEELDRISRGNSDCFLGYPDCENLTDILRVMVDEIRVLKEKITDLESRVKNDY